MEKKTVILEPSFTFSDRVSKAQWVSEKYKNILKGDVLDVSGDQMYLKKYLSEGISYTATGLGDHPDQVKVDLEKDKIPFKDNSFDCVMCLDVLEHIENNHEVFDKLCSLSKEWVLISLPNPLASLYATFVNSQYKPGRYMKFYGLPVERECDRHKWFFASSEAKEFVKAKAEMNGYEIYDLFTHFEGSNGLPQGFLSRLKVNLARKTLFRKDLNWADLYEGPTWWVLRKK